MTRPGRVPAAYRPPAQLAQNATTASYTIAAVQDAKSAIKAALRGDTAAVERLAASTPHQRTAFAACAVLAAALAGEAGLGPDTVERVLRDAGLAMTESARDDLAAAHPAAARGGGADG